MVGVLHKGDGSVYATRRGALRNGTAKLGYEIELKVVSKGFIEKFNDSCAIVLGRRPVGVRVHYDGCGLVVRYTAKGFCLWWLEQSTNSLSRLISKFPIEYLKGRFDSDGSVGRIHVYLCGAESHRDVMEFDRMLCVKLGMRTGIVRPYGKIGEVAVLGTRQIISKEQKLRFYVNPKDFARTIGSFSVETRDEKLKTFGKVRRAWTSWQAKIRHRALELASQGLEAKEIASRLSQEHNRRIPISTVYFWVKKGTLAWDEFVAKFQATE